MKLKFRLTRGLACGALLGGGMAIVGAIPPDPYSPIGMRLRREGKDFNRMESIREMAVPHFAVGFIMGFIARTD